MLNQVVIMLFKSNKNGRIHKNKHEFHKGNSLCYDSSLFENQVYFM